jgi:hypothetical protein
MGWENEVAKECRGMHTSVQIGRDFQSGFGISDNEYIESECV